MEIVVGVVAATGSGVDVAAAVGTGVDVAVAVGTGVGIATGVSGWPGVKAGAGDGVRNAVGARIAAVVGAKVGVGATVVHAARSKADDASIQSQSRGPIKRVQGIALNAWNNIKTVELVSIHQFPESTSPRVREI